MTHVRLFALRVVLRYPAEVLVADDRVGGSSFSIQTSRWQSKVNGTLSP